MYEAHFRARTLAVEGRGGGIGGFGLRKPEVVLPSLASGAGAFTAAFSVSAAGVVAPHFVVVDRQASGHAFVITSARDGGKQDKALSVLLSIGVIVWRRSPLGFSQEVFDVWAQNVRPLPARTTRARRRFFHSTGLLHTCPPRVR